jgi:alginate O-acetyltransferase complex protein AlgI
MTFSSITFILYFLPAFLIAYYFSPKKFKNIVLLLSSIFFYSWGAPKFIFVILLTTFIDFHLVKYMHYFIGSKKKILLFTSIGINLGLLFYFKYCNFFIDNLNAVLGVMGDGHISWAKLALPIGISFYTFESITYSVDVYRGILKPLKRFWDYQLYIIFFPKLIAGPIVRYQDIAAQIRDRSSTETMDNFLSGFYRFCIGLSKKVLIANVVGLQADQIINGNTNSLTCPSAWIGILAYTFQIYFDFSGYSDMAIGISKMVGFKIPENFNSPYTSKSISEFWRRWHISLGKWMKDYLYIPLGGNKSAKKWLVYRNLWVVFLLSGLWHGASWSFIIWGAYHGLFIILERGALGRLYARLGKYLPTGITFVIIAIGWVFFRIEDASKAFRYLSKMFDFSDMTSPDYNLHFWFTFVVAIFFSFFSFPEKGNKYQSRFYSTKTKLTHHISMTILTIVLFIACISSITSSGFNPFIYFRF